MKEEEIRDILNSHQICFAQHGTLCATVKAGIGAYQNGLGEIMHTMKDHILHINAQGTSFFRICSFIWDSSCPKRMISLSFAPR